MPSLTSFLTIGNTRVKVHTTDDADASPTPEAPVAAEELPIKEIVLDKPGRLLIDVVENTPRGKQTYRHRVSLDVMGQASPVWKEKIFGPAGQERQKPTANDNDDNDEDWTVLLRDDDDEPLHILVQLALIHDQPRWVPTWSDPATPGSCLQIANIIAAAEKYGVLPRLRPFVSDWLLHALPPSRIGGQDDINPEMIEQLNVAWQLGDVGRVEDYIRKLAYDSNVSAEVVEEMLVEAGDGPVGLFPALPALFGVVAKRREAGIQACLDFLLRLLLDLRSNEGACRQPIMCNIVLDMEISMRLEEEGPIPALAKDFHSSVSRLLYTIRCVHGMQDGAVPARQVPGHACLQNLRKKFEDFAAELRSRWSGAESILESEQVEWLKARRDVLATGGSS